MAGFVGFTNSCCTRLRRFGRRRRDELRGMVAVSIIGLVVLVLQKLAFTKGSGMSGIKESGPESLSSLNSTHPQTKTILMHTFPGPESSSSLNSTHPQTKTILMHTFPDWYKLRSGPGEFSTCDYPCSLTLDSGLTDEVDSVVVFSHLFNSLFPQQRSPRQIWAFFAVESPINWRNQLFQQPQWHNVFNWTMTYRRSSDFYFGYGNVVKRKVPPPIRDLSALVAGKSKLVAWFVSNCKTHSKREQYVKTLQDFIKVDVYGRCGPLKCGKEGDAECMAMLSRDYHFYLAFENSLCTDYLTEKIYRTMKKVDIVPVVRGGANYSALLPHHSFIDASQFRSVKALADYLKKVAGDRQLYESYLTWKNEWEVIEPTPFPFCEFCRRLHHQERWARVYQNIDSWWAEGQCHGAPSVVRS